MHCRNSHGLGGGVRRECQQARRNWLQVLYVVSPQHLLGLVLVTLLRAIMEEAGPAAAR